MSITIVTRAGKGSPLNATEHDANLNNLAAAVENTSSGHNHDGSNSRLPGHYVFLTSSVTLAGQDGVTVTHNRGNTNYLVKTLPTGIGSLGRIGDITYVKAANTVVFYNSGHGGFAADIELSNVA